MGHNGERILAKERLKPWIDAFPELTLIHGNHDKIPSRHMKKMGLDPNVFMRPLGEVMGFPSGWNEVDSITIDEVLYHHGMTACGQNGFRLDAQKRMCNTVTGHAHSNLGVSFTACQAKAVWGLAVGCGIDIKSHAFAYDKDFKNRPILGCGVVKGGHLPQAFAMPL
jgi:hypothetical protein